MLRYLLALAFLLAAPAHALCIYRGMLYAHPSFPQEFADSRWVVRAKVIAEQDMAAADSDWVRYRMQSLDRYKGDMPDRFDVLTRRDSGAFYLNAGLGTADAGRDYLLFLDPEPDPPVRGAAGGPATQVNYACGQSRPWSQISPSVAARLRRLARR